MDVRARVDAILEEFTIEEALRESTDADMYEGRGSGYPPEIVDELCRRRDAAMRAELGEGIEP